MNIFESIRNVFAIPDLRKRVLFTFALLGIYRIGSHLPTPGLDAAALEEFFKSQAGGLLGFLDIFSGGALRRLSVFALGITPYITSSIILQLLTVVWPYLEKLSKEGEMGREMICPEFAIFSTSANGSASPGAEPAAAASSEA